MLVSAVKRLLFYMIALQVGIPMEIDVRERCFLQSVTVLQVTSDKVISVMPFKMQMKVVHPVM